MRPQGGSREVLWGVELPSKGNEAPNNGADWCATQGRGDALFASLRPYPWYTLEDPILI